MSEDFISWLGRRFGLSAQEIHDLRLDAAFEVFLSRLEAASSRGAVNPLVTVTSKAAGGNSRTVTKRMLNQLGYEPDERRAVHRLFAGSTSTWPGLLRLYAEHLEPTPANRRYARRQILGLRAVSGRSPAHVAR